MKKYVIDTNAIISFVTDRNLAQQEGIGLSEAERWDRSLQTDIASGKLDALAAEALAQYGSGKCKPF